MLLAAYLDSTNLKADATEDEISKLCMEALHYQMAAVCVLPYRISLVQRILQDSGIRTATVIGFPLGNNMPGVKLLESRIALQDGADELDMVINLGALKDKRYRFIEDEIEAVLRLQELKDMVLKVIIETALLSREELINLTKLVSASGAHYIKTSTGMSSRGVSLDDIDLINQYKEPHLLIKASGGVRNRDFAQELVEHGVNRIGTSCAEKILAG